MTKRRSTNPSTTGVGPWLGVRSIADPYAIPPNYLSDAGNVYIPDGKGGSGAYARPGFRKVVEITIPEPPPPPPPPDTSAPVWIALLRGVNMYTAVTFSGGHASVVPLPSASGDLIIQWVCGAGTGRYAESGSFFLGDRPWRPKRDGDALRFGDNSGGLTSLVIGYIEPAEQTGMEGGVAFPTGGEVMARIKAFATPQPLDGGGLETGNLWGFNDTLIPKSFFTKSDGHLYDNFGVIRDAPIDAGVPPINVAADFCVHNVTVTPTLQTIRLNGQTLTTTALAPTGTPRMSFDVNASIGGGGSDNTRFNGWIADLVIFSAPLTTSQRAAWYAYLSGVTNSPPLPT